MSLSPTEIAALWLSVKAGFLSLALMLPFGIAVAWVLAKSSWRVKSVLNSLVMLPLVLPPVVSGYFLLMLFSKRSPVGYFLDRAFGLEIVFTWKAVVIAISVISFPLVVQSIVLSMQTVHPDMEASARALGAKPFRVFRTITLPLSVRGIVGGSILGFCRGLGEFGATMMLAGNIPGQTQTVSSAIYTYAQVGKDENAFRLVIVLTVVAFVALRFAERLYLKRLPY